MTENLETILLNLRPERIPITDIYVDPNNPRLSMSGGEQVPDERIAEAGIQQEAIERTLGIGVNDITEKIKRVGFLTVDRVVVRPLTEETYVVIEGNRRITAIKTLLLDNERGRINLSSEIVESMNSIEALVYEGDDPNISWLLQGLRHIQGVKNWGPLEQAKFLVEMKTLRGFSYSDLSSMVGIGRNNVATLMRSYSAWAQARESEVFGDRVIPDHFALFNEAVFKKSSLREWLGWNDTTLRFANVDNLNKLLEWYIGFEDENGNQIEPRITRVLEVRDVLSSLVLAANHSVLEEFENGNIDISTAATKLSGIEIHQQTTQDQVDLDVRLGELRDLLIGIQTLPVTLIMQRQEKAQSFIELLAEILNHASTQKRIIESH